MTIMTHASNLSNAAHLSGRGYTMFLHDLLQHRSVLYSRICAYNCEDPGRRIRTQKKRKINKKIY